MAVCQALRKGGRRRGGWKGEKKTNLKAKRSWSAPRVERGVFQTDRCVRARSSNTLFREQRWLDARPRGDSERGVIAAYPAACWIVLLGSSDSITPLSASAHLAVCAKRCAHTRTLLLLPSLGLGPWPQRIRAIICS